MSAKTTQMGGQQNQKDAAGHRESHTQPHSMMDSEDGERCAACRSSHSYSDAPLTVTTNAYLWPGVVGAPLVWWPVHELQVDHAGGAMPDAGGNAVRARVTATNHNHLMWAWQGRSRGRKDVSRVGGVLHVANMHTASCRLVL